MHLKLKDLAIGDELITEADAKDCEADVFVKASGVEVLEDSEVVGIRRKRDKVFVLFPSITKVIKLN